MCQMEYIGMDNVPVAVLAGARGGLVCAGSDSVAAPAVITPCRKGTSRVPDAGYVGLDCVSGT